MVVSKKKSKTSVINRTKLRGGKSKKRTLRRKYTKRVNKRKPRKVSKIKRGGVVVPGTFVPPVSPDNPAKETGFGFETTEPPTEGPPSLSEPLDKFEPVREEQRKQDEEEGAAMQGLFSEK